MAARKSRTTRTAKPAESLYSDTPPSASPSILERLVPILLLASVVLAFMVGVLWQKVSQLQKGGVVNAPSGQAGNNNVAPPDASGKLTDEQAKKLPPVGNGDYIRGNKKPQVYLIEYSDLQCPFCKQFHPTAQQVLKEYGDKVAWVYRHFPLEQIHPQAMAASIAAECVAKQKGEDGFWKFVDYAYENQTTALTALSDAAVKSAGVNKATFDSCLTDESVKSKVTEQYQKGVEAGVTGTPANFIVNAKGEVWLIPGALPFESLKVTIDEALKS